MDEVSSHVCLVLPSTDGKAARKIVPPRLRIPYWKGLGADSEEKHEPVSDIDTVVVDSLKALDPKRPIREAEIAHSRPEVPHFIGLLYSYRAVKRYALQFPVFPNLERGIRMTGCRAGRFGIVVSGLTPGPFAAAIAASAGFGRLMHKI